MSSQKKCNHTHSHNDHYEHDHSGNEGTHICNHVTSSSVSQSLDELSFERGIWGSVLSGDYDRVDTLLNKNKDLSNARDSSGFYPIHYAARSDSNFRILALLIDNGADPNLQTLGGATALHRSSFCGSVKNTDYLLNLKNIIVDIQDDDGMTPLHKAYEQGKTDIIDLLLKSNASTTIKDKRGRLPIDLLKQK
ncbi:hypothetical protein CYY_003395 [Polysphondylium violaceum]|uniref:Ankyrin repeat-containing protein n=1 Tax=Polysphondylium violaceum TaxID=133409 RepID=A0A8J4PUU6_9MYCE|nr:hypothetical protein CYY_003395 [Polysphondylium violaceum]